MPSEAEFEAFMERVMQRPLPTNPMARVRTLAKELAEGAAEEHWKPDIITDRGKPTNENIVSYLQTRWNINYPNLELLMTANFLLRDGHIYRISDNALRLIEEIEPTTIFISYRRRDSSAFALLVLARLKMAELDAFLDMSIQPGDDWHAKIKEQVLSHDHFVLLIGRHTLVSKFVINEIRWAIEGRKNIIPIWHNHFRYGSGQFDLDPEVDRVLRDTHAIQVYSESALGYNNAIVELLNRFGITP